MELEIIQSGRNNLNPQLPKDWQIKKLGEVCEVGAGNSAPQDKDLFLKGTYPFFRTSDVGRVKKGFIDSSIDRLNDEGIKKLKLFSKGTILFPKSGASTFLNHRVMMNVDGYVSSHLATIKSKAEYLNDKFLLYYLITIDAKHLMQDISYPSLKISDIKQIPIPLPPLSEQKKIVEVLDQAFAGIEQSRQNTKQNLKNAKEIFESYLQFALTPPQGDALSLPKSDTLSLSKSDALSLSKWEVKKLGEMCETGSGGTPLKTHKEYYDGGTIPWLLSGEVRQGEIFASKNFITEKGLKNSSAKLFPPNTVLVAMYGATAGQVGILRFESTTNQAICGILPNDRTVPEYIFYYFLSKKDELVAQAVGGAQPNISQIKIKNTIIPLPPLSEQKKIVQELDALKTQTESLEKIYNQKLSDLDELQKSLLQKAFAGEL